MTAKKDVGGFMDTIISLCKRRGFVFPGSEMYGGLANSWDYGPLGVELKNNIKQLWWKRFVRGRDDVVGIDAALIMNPKVWEASGHLANFSDPLVECKKCHARFRADQLDMFTEIKEEKTEKSKGPTISKTSSRARPACPECGGKEFSEAKQFNLMLKTFLGPAEEKANAVYFRPETAQASFVDFKQVLDTTRRQVPFGIAQVGKAFRNEITPGNFIFRTREFEQMEIEYFVSPPKGGSRTDADMTRNNAEQEEWERWFEHWRKEMWAWMTDDLGLDKNHVHELEIPEGERAHYSKRTVDFEYDYPFGRKELYGLAYRGDFDLKNHFPDAPPYRDAKTGETFWPHVIEPTWGVDRSVLAVLLDSYSEEAGRVVLKLNPILAPYQAAVFPLLANKPELIKLAREVYDDLRKKFSVAWDDRGNIGKRYYSQDEIGTPYCITVDFDSLEKGDATVRDRDSAKQERISIKGLSEYLYNKIFE